MLNTILQTFFVLIISTEPNAIELLYPVLNNSLIALAQDFVPITIGELSGRLSETMTRLADDAAAEVDTMAVSETIASLNAMLEMQQPMSTILGGIGELNIAEELVSILFKLLNATKDAYATLYYIAILCGGGPYGGGPGGGGGGGSGRRASLNSDPLKHVRDDLLGWGS